MPESTSDQPPSSDNVVRKKLVAKNNNMNGYADFDEFVKKIGDVRAAIFTHRCPDPDAMSSMMGIQWILKKVYGIESDLYYSGEVSHPQNIAMDNLLNPGLKRLSDGYNDSLYGLKILVDTIPENAGTLDLSINFDVVIDHHRDLPQNYNGILIHKKSGSCAAIICDMMRHFFEDINKIFDEDSDSDQKLATALIAGVVTDTEYMMSDDSTELEFKAFSDLFGYRNSNFLKQIIFFKRPKMWVDMKAKGCEEAKISADGIAIVALGIIPEKHRDLIADMAEEMLHWNSVEIAIAFGLVGDDRIEGSVRSLNPSLVVSEFCKKLGGTYGSGGGKHGKGAYRLPLAGFSIDPDEEQEDVEEAWESIRKRETKRIERTIKK